MYKIRFINTTRVLGLFLVLFYHLFGDILPGGFLGVDIFFTFSGYLITSLIISNFESKRNFNFLFYIKRRISRIFPSLFFSVLLTLPFIKLISTDFTVNIDKQVTAALGFVTNYFEIITGGSYESKLVPHLYIHTWSLALEIHYYLFWGIYSLILILILLKLKNDNFRFKLKIFKILLFISCIILTILSYSNMQILFSINSNNSVAYLSTTSHAYPFFIGSMQGILFGLKLSNNVSEKLKKKVEFLKIATLSLFSITLIVIFFICLKTNFENDFTYKYGFLITSILASILIFLARILHEILPNNYEEPLLIKHISNISYPMYLFHWPFFIIFSNLLSSKIIAAIFTLIVSYIFSVLTNYYIEPIFYKASDVKEKKFNNPPKNVVTALILLLSTTCVFINTEIFINRKEISGLEEEQIVGNIIQDIDKLEDLKVRVDNINEEPFIQKNGIQNFDNLENNSSYSQALEVKQEKERLQNYESLSDKKSEKVEDFQIDKNLLSESVKVTIIGDSVALGARKKLKEIIADSYVDTKGNRSLLDGYNILMELQKSNNLGEYIVIALGTNGCDNWDLYIKKIIDELFPGHRLIFVTPYNGNWNETWKSYQTMQYLRDIKDKYYFVTVADWADKISKTPELLGSDKTHIGGNATAINMFVDTILEGMNDSAAKNVKE